MIDNLKEIILSAGISITTAFTVLISTFKLISNNKSIQKKIENNTEIKALKAMVKTTQEQMQNLIEENATLRRSINQLTDSVRGVRERRNYDIKNKKI